MTTKSVVDSRPGSLSYDTAENLNDLIADVTALRTTVNAIITAAATNIAAVAAVTPAAALTSETVGNKAGTAL